MHRLNHRTFSLLIVLSGLLGAPAVHSSERQLNNQRRGVESRNSGQPRGTVAEALPPLTAENLEQAWAIALEMNPLIRAQFFLRQSAQSSLRAASAQRIPKLALSGGYTVQDNETGVRIVAPGLPFNGIRLPSSQKEYFSFDSTINVPIYTGSRIRNEIDSAAASVRVSELDHRVVVNDLKMQVGTAYVQVLRGSREVTLAESQAQRFSELARETELLFKNGRASRNDLLTNQTAFQSSRHEAHRSHDNLARARAAYNRHLGRPLDFVSRLAELPVQNLGQSLDDCTSCALARRPELARLGERAKAIRLKARSLRALYRPQVEVSGGYSYEENEFFHPQGIAAAGVQVSWLPFDGGQARHRAHALEYEAQALLASRRDIEAGTALAVRIAWIDCWEARRRIDVADQVRAASEENVRVARQRFAAGGVTSSSVLQAVAQHSRSERDVANARYDAILAYLRLRHAVGDL